MWRSFFLFLHALYKLLYRVVFVNTVYFKGPLRKQINSIYQQKNQPFNPRYFKRIYYHTMLGSITNSWFTTLRNFAPTTEETKAGIYIGAVSSVYDDLFDRYNFTMDETLDDLANGRYKYDNVTERMSKYFYDIILKNLADSGNFNHYLRKVGWLQEESKKQESKSISEDELRRITYEKGGYSISLYRSILQHPYQPGEHEAVYLLGRLIQMTDDVFDVRKDYINKISTLPTATKDIRLIRAEYEDLIHQSYEAFKRLNYPQRNVRRFFMQILIIVSRGMVCFNQLARVQEKHGGPFEIERYSRAELVCDMERPINLLRSFKYCLTWKF